MTLEGDVGKILGPSGGSGHGGEPRELPHAPPDSMTIIADRLTPVAAVL